MLVRFFITLLPEVTLLAGVEEHLFARQRQRQMIHEIEIVKPEFLVIVNVPNSWAYAPKAPRDIFTWTDYYTYANYNLVGRVDLWSVTKPQFRWDQATVGVFNLLLFKRKP